MTRTAYVLRDSTSHLRRYCASDSDVGGAMRESKSPDKCIIAFSPELLV